MRYIPIDKNIIPYNFEMNIEGEQYKFEVFYNDRFDFFTIDLYKNEELVVLGEKLVYGKPLFLTSLHRDTPPVLLMPFDVSEQENRVTFENMDDSVLLYFVDWEGDDFD